MADVILFNKEIYHITEDGLPCLIHSAPKMGGSHFTVSMIADLFLRGSKILFLTAYPMARENFMRQIEGNESKTAYITDESQFNAGTQAIILESGNEELFLKAIERLGDIDRRVVLVKNIEVFSEAVIDSCLKLEKIIISGDLDKCLMKQRINDKQYRTIVLFSKPEMPLMVVPPVLEKYHGYLWSENREGVVAVKFSNEDHQSPPDNAPHLAG